PSRDACPRRPDVATRGPAGQGAPWGAMLAGPASPPDIDPVRPQPGAIQSTPEAAMRPTRLIRFAFLLAVPFTLAVGAAPAGAQAGTGGQEDVRSRLGGVSLLLLETADGEVVRGQPVGWVDDWLLLREGRRIALGEILRAEALHRRTGDGARWGAIVGLVAGAGVFLSTQDQEEAGVARGVAYISGGTLAGAAVGALWGSRRYRSELIYSAPTANVASPQAGLIEYRLGSGPGEVRSKLAVTPFVGLGSYGYRTGTPDGGYEDRKSTRLNSSHVKI